MKSSTLNASIQQKTADLDSKVDGQIIYSGSNQYKVISGILSEYGTKRPMLVHDSTFDKSFLKDYIQGLPMKFVQTNIDAANYDNIAAATSLFNQENCDFILSIGNAGVIDAAKCIKLFSVLNADECYLNQEYRHSTVQHIALPTTAGTGNESTNSAKIYVQGESTTVNHVCLAPEQVILEPGLLNLHSDYRKKTSLMDALCQAIDSFWSINSTPKSRDYAEQAISLILENYNKYLTGDYAATSAIQIAANLSGQAANISQTSAAHALSEKLADVQGIAHGHAVGLCLINVWKYMSENPDRCVDPRGLSHVNKIFRHLNEIFGVTNTEEAISKFASVLIGLGLESYTDELYDLQRSVNLKKLNNCPVDIGFYGIKEITEAVLQERKSNINNASLDKHKRRTLEAYDWFQNICKENAISYVVLGGSLVGSLRHGGFVPWDDDIDIGIRIPDLDKFRKLSKATLPPGFAWSHPDTNRSHPRLFGKIVYEGRCCLDLFPIVITPKNTFLSMLHHKTIRYLYKVYLRKIKYGKLPKRNFQKRASYIIARFSSLFISRDRIISFSEKVMHLFEGREAKKYLSICGRYPHRKELIKKNWIEKGPDYISFEGRSIPVFHNYMDYLKRLYGNFMVMPPVKSRVSDHILRIPTYNIKGFIPSYMPQLQKMVCEILKEFIAICEQYNLKYYAISGTTLGAVRHNGFIPWDDDVDIGMPREDYDTFLKVAPKNLSSNLFLQTYETEPGCPRYFAKIRNSNTTFIEVGAKPDKRNRGIYLDIFPLDGFPRQKLKQLQCRLNLKLYEVAISYLYNNFSIKSNLARPDFFKRVANRMLGWTAVTIKFRGKDIAQINRAMEDYFTKFKYSECELVFSYGGVYGIKEMIPKSYLGDGINVKFEDIDLVIPEKYHEYLSHFYGDYMKFPEEHKRSVGHPRKIVDLNKSYTFYQ